MGRWDRSIDRMIQGSTDACMIIHIHIYIYLYLVHAHEVHDEGREAHHPHPVRQALGAQEPAHNIMYERINRPWNAYECVCSFMSRSVGRRVINQQHTPYHHGPDLRTPGTRRPPPRHPPTPASRPPSPSPGPTRPAPPAAWSPGSPQLYHRAGGHRRSSAPRSCPRRPQARCSAAALGGRRRGRAAAAPRSPVAGAVYEGVGWLGLCVWVLGIQAVQAVAPCVRGRLSLTYERSERPPPPTAGRSPPPQRLLEWPTTTTTVAVTACCPVASASDWMRSRGVRRSWFIQISIDRNSPTAFGERRPLDGPRSRSASQQAPASVITARIKLKEI